MEVDSLIKVIMCLKVILFDYLA